MSFENSIGIESCFDLLPCTEFDYEFEMTPCNNNKRVKKYRWTVPKYCKDSKIQLPKSTEIDCTFCRPGSHKQGSLENSLCSFCPPGT